MSDIMLMGKNPNYLGSWDLYDVPNGKIQVTIAKIQDEEIINAGKKEGATVCFFAENVKPMILNLTNKKTLARLFKTKDADKFIGKRIEIGYEKVKAFGQIHDALRIQNSLILQKSVEAQPKATPLPKCENCNGDITPANGMTAEQVAKYTLKGYGKKLCGKCAVEVKKQREVESNAE